MIPRVRTAVVAVVAIAAVLTGCVPQGSPEQREAERASDELGGLPGVEIAFVGATDDTITVRLSGDATAAQAIAVAQRSAVLRGTDAGLFLKRGAHEVEDTIGTEGIADLGLDLATEVTAWLALADVFDDLGVYYAEGTRTISAFAPDDDRLGDLLDDLRAANAAGDFTTAPTEWSIRKQSASALDGEARIIGAPPADEVLDVIEAAAADSALRGYGLYVGQPDEPALAVRLDFDAPALEALPEEEAVAALVDSPAWPAALTALRAFDGLASPVRVTFVATRVSTFAVLDIDGCAVSSDAEHPAGEALVGEWVRPGCAG